MNGYKIEDTLVFEPDKDIFLVSLLEITNTGNDISSNTEISVFPGKFYETIADSLPADASLSGDHINLSLGALVPGEMKRIYLHFRLKEDIKDKIGLMKLIAASEVRYEGTSIDASYGYTDSDPVLFGIHDFQLYAVTSRIEGNTVTMKVSAVNRGLPATNVALRIYPVVGDGIAELPLAEVTVDSIASYEEIILDAEYTVPVGEEVEFLAIVDDGDHTVEVFEINNQLRFKAGENISGMEALMQDKGATLYAFPNPFREMLWIKYYLEEPSTSLVLSILDLNGKMVHTVNGLPSGSGTHIVGWTGSGLKDGLYIIEVHGSDQTGESFRAEMKVMHNQ